MTPRPEAVALLAACLSVVLWRRRSEHGPIAFVLCLSAARDVAGALVPLSCRVDLAWLLCVGCAGGWAYERAWNAPRYPLRPWIALALAFASPGWLRSRDVAELARWAAEAPIVLFGLTSLLGAGWMLVARLRGDAPTCASDAALVLLAGDACGAAFGMRPDLLPGMAAMQLAAVSLVQVAWLARPRS